MGQIIVKNAVVRKPGFLYYINANGDLCEAKMVRKTAAKKTTAKKATVKKTAAKKSK